MEDKELLEFHQLAQEVKKWFEEREIDCGYTDTYVGHFAIFIQRKMSEARQKERELLLVKDDAPNLKETS